MLSLKSNRPLSKNYVHRWPPWEAIRRRWPRGCGDNTGVPPLDQRLDQILSHQSPSPTPDSKKNTLSKVKDVRTSLVDLLVASDVGALQLKNIRESRSFSDSGKDRQ